MSTVQALRWMLPAALLIILSSCGALVDLPDRYALVYGVSDYGGGGNGFNISNLSLPDDDAADMESLLLSQGYTVTVRTNEQATRAAFEADLEALASQVDQQDIVVVYFAGHGFGDGMEEQYSQSLLDFFAAQPRAEADGSMDEYLFFHKANGSTDMSQFIAEQSLTDDQIGALLKEIPARRKVVLIDACHSGGFLSSDSTVDGDPANYQGSEQGVSTGDAVAAMGLYFSGSGGESDISSGDSVVLAASGEREFTWEDGALENGVFTHFLVESATTGDRNGDGFITISELYHTTQTAVADYWNTRYSGSSQFLPRVSGSPTDFALFKAP